MKTLQSLMHREKLIAGEEYILRDYDLNGTQMIRVVLLAESTCPAVVIVIQPNGFRRYCDRMNLFRINHS